MWTKIKAFLKSAWEGYCRYAAAQAGFYEPRDRTKKEG